MTAKPGPLSGLTVVEMAGLGPVPLAGLILSEMGADVIRIERVRTDRAFLSLPPKYDLDRHGREILRVDLKQAQGVELVLRLVEKADALIEGFRPGVMEKLGLGPEIACARNPGLIYGRMTGFGQTGPMAQRAGHDLTYLAYTGILHAIGQKGGRPVPPLNLVADYGGGTMLLITGMLAALFERFKSGKGQVIDAAMIDGASMLATPFFGFMAAGLWQDRRGENLLDSGAPFYDTYETADGKHIAVACLEPQFFAEFCRLLPLNQRFAEAQYDKSLWDEMREAIADRVRMKSRDEWSALFEDTDACVAPVLSLKEAPNHPHNRARQAYVEAGALLRSSPAPRFSRSGTQAAMPIDSTSATILSRFGISGTEIETLAKEGIVGK
ncbi:CaiB/BaiF CoA-transferase family protein [Mesorhizobium sp. DCY119]|uniref:CaiB/BaiF CoA transferase family protein n=1 Tax=Mesorhizobium sp. DCY119 TaxID=2108445 RepID=UPI000E6D3056|nr:CaiB/BaiF CoA-transferase family protein [Mesorhizobium sp. DCY119]RJG44147.1 CoA transferase [Mesorhizobium sp. DCY119]